MEEKKLGKTVKLDAVKNANKAEETHKLSYEQLNNVCSQLYQENQRLLREVQQLNLANMFKRLDYLFEVLKASAVIKDDAFVAQCVEEIKKAMAVTSEEKEETEGKK
jgi:hypothetical protein